MDDDSCFFSKLVSEAFILFWSKTEFESQTECFYEIHQPEFYVEYVNRQQSVIFVNQNFYGEKKKQISFTQIDIYQTYTKEKKHRLARRMINTMLKMNWRKNSTYDIDIDNVFLMTPLNWRQVRKINQI